MELYLYIATVVYRGTQAFLCYREVIRLGPRPPAPTDEVVHGAQYIPPVMESVAKL